MRRWLSAPSMKKLNSASHYWTRTQPITSFRYDQWLMDSWCHIDIRQAFALKGISYERRLFARLFSKPFFKKIVIVFVLCFCVLPATSKNRTILLSMYVKLNPFHIFSARIGIHQAARGRPHPAPPHKFLLSSMANHMWHASAIN